MPSEVLYSGTSTTHSGGKSGIELGNVSDICSGRVRESGYSFHSASGAGVIPPEIEQQVIEWAMKAANWLNYLDTGAIEFFVTKDGQLFVNEMAPRPNNSGHHTIELQEINQYTLQALILRIKSDVFFPYAGFSFIIESNMNKTLFLSGLVHDLADDMSEAILADTKIVFAFIRKIIKIPELFTMIYLFMKNRFLFLASFVSVLLTSCTINFNDSTPKNVEIRTDDGRMVEVTTFDGSTSKNVEVKTDDNHIVQVSTVDKKIAEPTETQENYGSCTVTKISDTVLNESFKVAKGEFVVFEKNLVVNGILDVEGTLVIKGSLIVNGDFIVKNNTYISVEGNTTVNGMFDNSGFIYIWESLNVNGGKKGNGKVFLNTKTQFSCEGLTGEKLTDNGTATFKVSNGSQSGTVTTNGNQTTIKDSDGNTVNLDLKKTGAIIQGTDSKGNASGVGIFGF